MNFPVPWRALLPLDAVPVVTGPNGVHIREICDATGAAIDISSEGETPETLSDKIVTISGAVEQKEAACRRVVDKLRGLQEVADQEPGVYVIIVPSCAAPMVVGQKGCQIKEVIDLSGAEISVGKENIIGMLDQPIGITGTAGQVVSAVSKINAIMQDCADRGRLQPSDFKYRPGMAQQGGLHMEPAGGFRGPAQSGGNPRTNAKFVCATQVAGWIIGKQGRHIRELQENSGAHIQVHKEGEVPPGVSPTDRVVEIGGRADAKAEGVQIVLMAVDSMPALQAPRETQMLVTKALTKDSEIKDVQQMSGCEVEVRDLPGHEEALCTLLGTIEARVKAAQQFLIRLEEVVQDGSAADVGPYSPPAQPTRPREQPPSRIEQPPPVSSMTAEPSKATDPWANGDPWSGGKPIAPQPREQPQRQVEPSPQLSAAPAVSQPKMSFGRDPEPEQKSFSPGPVAPTSGGISQTSFGPSGGASQTSFAPTGGASQTSFGSSGGAGQTSFGPSGGTGQTSFGPSGGASQTSFGPSGGASQTSFGPSGGAGQTSFGPSGGSSQTSFGPSSSTNQTSFGPTGGASQTSFGPSGGTGQASFGSAGGGGQTSFGPTGGAGQTSFGPSGSTSQTSFGPDSGAAGQTSFSPTPAAAGAGGQTSFSPNPAPQSGGCAGAGGMQTSFSPTGPSGPASSSTAMTTFSPSGPPSQAMTSFSPGGFGSGGMMGMGSMMGGMGGMMGPMGGGHMGMMGMGGMAGNEAMFRAALMSANMGQPSPSQLVVMLPAEVLQALVSQGHLADIAQKCGIRIDLGEEVPQNLRQVNFTGSVAANAMAAYFVQERGLQLGGIVAQ